MLTIRETKIVNVNKNKFRDLKISFIIKSEDYTKDLEDKFFELYENGNLLAIGIQETEFTEDSGKNEKEIRNKLLQDLEFFMRKYIEKLGGEYEVVKQDFYKKYNIKSRTELTNQQLKYELELFKNGLNYE